MNFKFLLILLLFSFELKAQTFKIIVIDSKQNKDSVCFGNPYSKKATTGIDSLLGERNIFGTPYDLLEIRSIQRDSLTFHCLKNRIWSDDDVFFNENIDLKFDYRFSYVDGWYYEPENRNYEFHVRGVNYPIYVLGKTDRSSDFYTFELLDSTCGYLYDLNTYLNSSDLDTLFVLKNDNYCSILFYLEQPAGIKKLSSFNIDISPNPFTDVISIKGNLKKVSNFTIFDISSHLIYQSKFNGEELILNLSKLKSGFYYINFEISKNETLFKKLVKY